MTVTTPDVIEDRKAAWRRFNALPVEEKRRTPLSHAAVRLVRRAGDVALPGRQPQLRPSPPSAGGLVSASIVSWPSRVRDSRLTSQSSDQIAARLRRWAAQGSCPTPLGRFFASITVTERGCWVWGGSPDPGGYGRITLADGKRERVHRFAYRMFVGPIPDGLTIDHLCRVRLCANPKHLEAVTSEENVRRGDHFLRRRTSCRQGHPFDAENTIVRRGARICRACDAAYFREYRARRRAALQVAA